MKFSDIMLDLDTGDASIDDAYIQESIGQVKVASAIFKAAKLISEADYETIGSMKRVIQEAGLPTDEEGAKKTCNKAIEKELNGAYKTLMSINKKISGQTKKVIGVITGVSNHYGITSSGESISPKDFKDIVSAIKKDKDTELSKQGKEFVKGSVAIQFAKKYVNSMVAFYHAFGTDLSGIFDDPVIKSKISLPKKYNGECKNLSSMLMAFEEGTKNIGSDTDITDDDRTSDISASDIGDLLISVYSIHVTAKYIAENAGARLDVEYVNSVISEKASDSDCEKADKSIPEAVDAMKALTDSSIKTLGDDASIVGNLFK